MASEGFDVINGDWVSFGLAGRRRGHFGHALGLRSVCEGRGCIIYQGAYSKGAVQKVGTMPWGIIDCVP